MSDGRKDFAIKIGDLYYGGYNTFVKKEDAPKFSSRKAHNMANILKKTTINVSVEDTRP